MGEIVKRERRGRERGEEGGQIHSVWGEGRIEKRGKR